MATMGSNDRPTLKSDAVEVKLELEVEVSSQSRTLNRFNRRDGTSTSSPKSTMTKRRPTGPFSIDRLHLLVFTPSASNGHSPTVLRPLRRAKISFPDPLSLRIPSFLGKLNLVESCFARRSSLSTLQNVEPKPLHGNGKGPLYLLRTSPRASVFRHTIISQNSAGPHQNPHLSHEHDPALTNPAPHPWFPSRVIPLHPSRRTMFSLTDRAGVYSFSALIDQANQEGRYYRKVRCPLRCFIEEDVSFAYVFR